MFPASVLPHSAVSSSSVSWGQVQLTEVFHKRGITLEIKEVEQNTCLWPGVMQRSQTHLLSGSARCHPASPLTPGWDGVGMMELL